MSPGCGRELGRFYACIKQGRCESTIRLFNDLARGLAVGDSDEGPQLVVIVLLSAMRERTAVRGTRRRLYGVHGTTGASWPTTGAIRHLGRGISPHVGHPTVVLHHEKVHKVILIAGTRGKG